MFDVSAIFHPLSSIFFGCGSAALRLCAKFVWFRVVLHETKTLNIQRHSGSSDASQILQGFWQFRCDKLGLTDGRLADNQAGRILRSETATK